MKNKIRSDESFGPRYQHLGDKVFRLADGKYKFFFRAGSQEEASKFVREVSMDKDTLDKLEDYIANHCKADDACYYTHQQLVNRLNRVCDIVATRKYRAGQLCNEKLRSNADRLLGVSLV